MDQNTAATDANQANVPAEKLPRRAMKPDAQGFDEIRIITVPRFKESELSGGEWRISARTQFLRNGVVIHEIGAARDVAVAAHHLGYRLDEAFDNAQGYFAGEGSFCDQEGCCSTETRVFQLKKGYNRDGTERSLGSGGEYRRFCKQHSHRGDCGLEDADDNYVAGA